MRTTARSERPSSRFLTDGGRGDSEVSQRFTRQAFCCQCRYKCFTDTAKGGVYLRGTPLQGGRPRAFGGVGTAKQLQSAHAASTLIYRCLTQLSVMLAMIAHDRCDARNPPCPNSRWRIPFGLEGILVLFCGKEHLYLL